MKKFMVLYYAPSESIEQSANSSVEDHSNGMEAWAKWADKCGDHLLDMGAPLNAGLEFNSEERLTQDKTSIVSGYSILEADNIKDALGLLNEHPHLLAHAGNSIGLHEEIPMAGTM